MKKMSLITWMLVLLFQINCKKTVVSVRGVTPKNDSTYLNEFWKNDESVYSMSPVLNSDSNVLVSHLDMADNVIFKLLDRKTGNVIWSWNDYFQTEGLFLESSRLIDGDRMYLAIGNRTYCIDIVNGKTLWRHKMINMIGESSFTQSSTGAVYRAFYDEINGYMSMNVLLNSIKGYEEIFTIQLPTPNADEMFLGNLNVNKILNNDILAFTLFVRNKVGSPEEYMGAYDLTNRELRYLKNESNIVSSFSRVPGLMEDSVMISFGSDTKGNWSVFALNALNGNLIWSKIIPDFGVSVKLFNSNLIVLCNGSSNIYSLNKINGAVFWTTPNLSVVNQFNGFNFYNHIITGPYLITSQCEYLTAYELNTGRRILEKKIINQSSCCMDYAIAIDKYSNRFYVSDRRYVHCFALPPEIKFN